MAEASGVWDEYRAWNAALAESFFNGSAVGRPVYLDVEDDLLSSAGQRVHPGLGAGTAEFSAAVSATVARQGGRLFSPHRDACERWIADGRDGPPPVIALLCLFTCAAERMQAGAGFAPNDYYGRLCELLGIDPEDKTAHDKLVRDYRAQAGGFWAELNRWLLEAGGARGLPTAAAFDWRVHVGIPIAQALIRAADREYLRDMFMSFGLRPHQQVARDDMKELLEVWTPDAPPTLHRLLTGADVLREHIADIAVIELAAWDGHARRRAAGESTAAPRDGALLLVAQYRQGVWQRLGLDLAVFGDLDGVYTVPPEMKGPAAEAARLAGTITAEQAAEGWTTFRTDSALSIPDVLKGSLTLTGQGGRFERPARRVVVLEEDSWLPWLVERPRVQLWEDTWLLVHDVARGPVESLLERVARPGFRRLAPGDLSGVPEGWSFFDRVQIVVSPGEVASGSEDLLPLVPLSDSQVAAVGGRPLVGHATFHTSGPPEIRAAAAGGRDATVTVTSEFLYEGATRLDELGQINGAGVFDLSALRLAAGDYRVILRDLEGRALTTAAFRLRDAEHALVPSPWLSTWSGHVLVDQLLTWEGVQQTEPPSNGWLRGGQASGLPSASAPPRLELPTSLGVSGAEREDDAGPAQAVRAVSQSDMPCPPHHMRIPSTDDRGRMPRRYKGYCVNCGVEKWYRRSAGGRRNVTSAAAAAARAPSFVLPTLSPATGASRGDATALLDAVTTVGAGSWASFERLVGSIDDAPWAAVEYARTLTSLGHLEFSAGRHGWATVPPMLIRRADTDRSAFLAGARRSSLVEKLEQSALVLGAKVTRITQVDAPELVRLDVLDSGDLEILADDLGMSLVPSPSEAIIEACENIRLVAAERPITGPPGGRLGRYDARSGRWTDVPAITGDGAYRVEQRPMRYLVVSAGKCFDVDNPIAKYAAAAAEGIAGMAYGVASQVLYAPLGARLPGLYERAVVLCSGQAPVATRDGKVAYRDVPVGVAAAVWSKLGPEGWKER